VLDAEIVIASPSGERVVGIADLHRGPYETACEQHELITEIRLPIRAGQGSAYEKVERRVGDWAVAAAGASVVLEEDGRICDVTVGLTALGTEGCVPGILEALCEQRPSEALFAEAGRLAAASSSPVEDQRGPVDYKRHLADELTRRVLRRSVQRASALVPG
jgi:aerobic carbon-monoxide dehydrogenase medium subunit